MSISKEKILKSLEKLGWHLNPETIEDYLAENPKITPNEIVKKTLNCDLRSIGAKYLVEEWFQGKCEKFDGYAVLQLTKLRNIAAPKENESSGTAPRMYKMALTDGTTNCNALVLDEIPKLNLNTPPGTKVLLIGPIKVKCGMLLLDNRNMEVLGGEVDYMVAKWKANKDLFNHIRTFCQTDNPPPPWVPFGAKQMNLVDTSKKVFAENQQNEVNESSEFSQARQAALAEALEAKSKVTKMFTQMPIDKTQVVDMTSSANPNSQLHPRSVPIASRTTDVNEKKGKKPRKGRRGGDRSDEEDYVDVKGAPKPKEATLFDAFKAKLDINDDDEQTNVDQAQSYEREPPQRFNRGRGDRQQQQRRFKNQPNPSTMSKPTQQYNPNDFNFDLDGGQVAAAEAAAAAAAAAAAVATNVKEQKTFNTSSNDNQPRPNQNQNNYRQQGKRNNENRNRQQYQQPHQQQYEFQQYFQQPEAPLPPPPVQSQFYYPPLAHNQNTNYESQQPQYKSQYDPQFNYEYSNQYQTRTQQQPQQQQQQQRTFYNSRGGGRGGGNRNYRGAGDGGGNFNY